MIGVWWPSLQEGSTNDVNSLDTPFGRKHLIEAIKWAARKDAAK